MGSVTGLKVEAGDGQNRLTWDALTGATSYNIYFETSSSSSFTSALVADCSGDRIEGVTGTSYTHTRLVNGVTYLYNIVGVGSNGEGTCGVHTTLPSGTPSAPQVYGCNHPDATNYDPTVTVYVPGSCWWPTPTPTPAPDTTEPTTTVAPTRSAQSAASRSLSATINEAGSGYCTALTGLAAAPTSAEVVANNNANVVGTGGTVAMTANGAATCTVTGLTVGGTYDFYFVAKDTAGNLQAAPTKASLTCPAGMVKFTGGTFTMGDDTDANGNNPEHTVTLSDFCIDAKEVTQAQHAAWGADTTWTAYAFDADANCGGSRTTCPAESVDWTNAQAYCVAQGKRLPTEAEWEYAARNGGTAPVDAYATGEVDAFNAPVVPVACTDANYNFCNGGGATSAVGSYAASSSGLFDMAGNVWEWTGDRYDAGYYANGQVNPTGPGAGADRVDRGGSWGNGFGFLRASVRGFTDPAARGINVGFRCSSN